MRQLVMHAHDEETGVFEPVYVVCRLEGQTLVRAMRRAWTDTARRVEQALNSPRGRVHRAASHVCAAGADQEPVDLS